MCVCEWRVCVCVSVRVCVATTQDKTGMLAYLEGRVDCGWLGETIRHDLDIVFYVQEAPVQHEACTPELVLPVHECLEPDFLRNPL